MRRIASIFNAALALGLLAFAFQGLTPVPAISQSNTVFTQGNLVNGHAVQAVANRIIADACGHAGGQSGACITDLGITNAGLGFGINSGPTTSPYNFFDMGFDANGNALLSIGRVGAGTQPGFNVSLNGSTSSYPGNGQGNILGPVSSTIGDVACWNNITGTLLRDCSTANVVSNLTVGGSGTFTGAVSAPSLTLTTTPLPATSGGTGDAGGVFTLITPNTPVSCGTGTITTLGSSAQSYKKFGRVVFLYGEIGITTNGTCATNIQAPIPFAAVACGVEGFAGSGKIVGNSKQLLTTIGCNQSIVFLNLYDGTYPGADSTILIYEIWYESAS